MKKKELNNTEYQLLQDYIILRLFHEYSWRNDIASIHVIDDEKKIEENKNYLVVGDEYKIILQQYKTFKRYGKKEYTLDKNLKRLVKKLLKYNNTGYLLLNKNRKSKMSKQKKL